MGEPTQHQSEGVGEPDEQGRPDSANWQMPRRRGKGKGMAVFLVVLLLIAIVALAWPRGPAGPAGFTGVKTLAEPNVDWEVNYRVNSGGRLGEIVRVQGTGNRDTSVQCPEGARIQVELNVFGAMAQGKTATVEIWSRGQLRERATSSPTGGTVTFADC